MLLSGTYPLTPGVSPLAPLGLYLISSFPAVSMASQSIRQALSNQAKTVDDLSKTLIGCFSKLQVSTSARSSLQQTDSPQGP